MFSKMYLHDESIFSWGEILYGLRDKDLLRKSLLKASCHQEKHLFGCTGGLCEPNKFIAFKSFF